MLSKSIKFTVMTVYFYLIATPVSAEVISALYQTQEAEIHVELEEVKDILKSGSTLNFPQIIEFNDNIKGLAYGQGAHYGGETRIVRLSKDGGESWEAVSRTRPLGDDIQNSGLLGYLSDGTIIYINAMPEEYRPSAKHIYFDKSGRNRRKMAFAVLFLYRPGVFLHFEFRA